MTSQISLLSEDGAVKEILDDEATKYVNANFETTRKLDITIQEEEGKKPTITSTSTAADGSHQSPSWALNAIHECNLSLYPMLLNSRPDSEDLLRCLGLGLTRSE